MPPTDVFEAAHDGDLAAVRAALDAGFDVAAVDEHGWSLLHRAATGRRRTRPVRPPSSPRCWTPVRPSSIRAVTGAPDGSIRKMEQAGELVVGAFRGAGFRVDRNGAGDSRPSVGPTG
ncbi:ankyrin repeat domain-containing protein [Streptomyces sp. NPDC127117]|uniref:ankyrin repeat domain-containing protein n=1 Tax=Streptomyces sp. NPDC127117 TaxID=3345368 RepID=UPI003641A225